MLFFAVDIVILTEFGFGIKTQVCESENALAVSGKSVTGLIELRPPLVRDLSRKNTFRVKRCLKLNKIRQ
jgi:hypothetical protein